jgi:putative ABC transport system ATP-binding protein
MRYDKINTKGLPMKNPCFLLNQVKVKDILTIDHLAIDSQVITCILGPSGSGKTTLLRLLNKLISVDSGSIMYLNQDI